MASALVLGASAVALVGGTPVSAATPSGPPASTAAYVVDSYGNVVWQYTVAADGSLTADATPSVASGSGPFSMALSPNGKSAYVANQLDSTISQYDVAADGSLTPKAKATVAAHYGPTSISISPDGNSAYVATQDGNGLTNSDILEYNVASNGNLSPKSSASVQAGSQPEQVVVNPNGKTVYVLDEGTSLVFGGQPPPQVFEYRVGAGGTLIPEGSVATGQVPAWMALSPNGKYAYVSNTDAGSYDGGGPSISQFTIGPNGLLTPNTPAVLSLGNYLAPELSQIAPTGDGKSLIGVYAAGILNFKIAPNGTLSPATPSSTPLYATPLIEEYPTGLAFNANGQNVYVSNYLSQEPDGADTPDLIAQFAVGAKDVLGPMANAETLIGTGAANSFPFPIVLNAPRQKARLVAGALLNKAYPAYTANAVLVDSSGQPIAGQTITFTTKGTPVCQATTNGTGVATCKNLSVANAEIANNGYTASYSGNYTYGAASAAGTLT